MSNSTHIKYFRLATKLIAVVLLSSVFFAPISGAVVFVHANDIGSDTTPAGAGGYLSGTPTVGSTGGAGGSVPATTASASPSPGGAVADNLGCGLSTPSICISNIVYVFTVGFMSILAYIGAYIFDVGVQLTLQTVTYSQLFLTQGWAAVRDFANMAFIFILVYIAITIILSSDTSSTLRMLAVTVIMALLINFSFFFVRVVIDAGNILAIQFYNAIDAPPLATSASAAAATSVTTYGPAITNALPGNGQVKDLTANIMNLLGVQTLLGSGSFSKTFAENNPGGADSFLVNLIVFSFIYIIVGIILAMLAFVFITVGIKFLVRIVALWLAIIASPLALVARAIMQKNSTAQTWYKRWRDTLIQYSFYPAVFLFIFWIINTITTQLSGGCTTTSGASCGIIDSAFSGLAGSSSSGSSFLIPLASAVSGVGVRLGIVIILLFMAMKASDSIAKTGITAVDGAVDKFSGRVGNFVSRRVPRYMYSATGGAAYRNLAARPAVNVSKKLAESKWANEKSFLNWRNRVAYGVQQKIAKPIGEVKVLGSQSLTQVNKYSEDRKKAQTANNRRLENERDIKEFEALESAYDADRAKDLKQKEAERDEFEKQTKIKLSIESDSANDKLKRRLVYDEDIERREKELARLARLEKTNGVAGLSQADLQSRQGHQMGIAAAKTKIATEGDLTNDENSKLEKLKSANERLAALGTPSALSAADKRELESYKKDEQRMNTLKIDTNSLSKAEVEAVLKEDDIKKLIRHINEPLMKKIEESDKYSDKTKAELRKLWQEKSDDAPLRKFQKQIEELKGINKKLEHIDATLKLSSIETHTAPNSLMDSAALKAILAEIVTKVGDADVLGGKKKARGQEQLRDLKIVVTKLNDEGSKIPPELNDRRK
jgi:hypothetical protein